VESEGGALVVVDSSVEGIPEVSSGVVGLAAAITASAGWVVALVGAAGVHAARAIRERIIGRMTCFIKTLSF
jgi:hypothetical protein